LATSKKVLLEPSTLGPSPARDMYAARLGSLLKPARIAQILTLADQGQPADLHDLLNELRQKDGVLHSVLQTREDALLGVGWTIQPFVAPSKKKATAQNEKIAALCSEWVGQIKGLDRAIAHLADANYKGFSVCEILWKKQGKYIVPSELLCHQGRRFAFDETQKLRWYDDGLKLFPGIDFLGQWPHRFLVHQPRINGDSPSREGLGRTLVWLVCWRVWAWRDWMLFSELYGKPWRIVTIKREGGGDEDLEAAHDIADNATSSTSIVKYDSVDVEFAWPESKGGSQSSPSPSILGEASKDIALCVLGQQATTGQVTGGLGGKGAAHENVRKDILKADDRAESGTLKDGLLAKCVLLNFGPRASVPGWSFNTAETKDTKAFADTLDVATNKLGMDVPVGYAHDEMGIPKPQAGEPVLRGTRAQAQVPAKLEPKPEPPQPEDDPTGEPPADPSGDDTADDAAE
jgi:phage gp29-like protein